MKKLLFIALIALGLKAEIIDKIVATVNKEPITSYEIITTAKKMHISPNQALNYLIDQKIIEDEIKRRGISVDNYDIEMALDKIAKRNGMTLFEFKNVLRQRGQYKPLVETLRKKLLREKLFAQIIGKNLNISPDELKNYYNTHKNEFKVFKTIQVTKYTSNSPEVLKNLRKNTALNLPNAKLNMYVYTPNDLPKNMLFLFMNTKVGQFTPVFNEGDKFVTYYVSRKDGEEYLPFDEVKDIIINKILDQKRNSILQEYFSKLKNRADIKIYNN